MYIPYNSRLEYHKSIFGAVKTGQTVTFRIILPRDFCCHAAKLVIKKAEDAQYSYINMQWDCMEGVGEEWWKIDFTAEDAALYKYHFEYDTSWGTSRIYHVGNGLAAIKGEGDDWQLTVYDKNFHTPEWLKGGIIYQIFPDRFAFSGTKKQNVPSDRVLRTDRDGDPYWIPTAEGKVLNNDYFGGDLDGIRSKLPYLKDLGVTCIYLNPIFAAESYHRYDTLDYYEIDPHMGTKEDLRTLVSRAHTLGIRVILDGVFNHISSNHFLFRDVLEKGRESQYFSCFYRLPEHPRLPVPGEMPSYTCFSYVPNMPKTNTADPWLRRYFCEVGTYWIREFSVDGWRLDVANELDDGFLRAFRTAVKEAKPDALIVGEVWENAAHYLNGDMLDSAMNYDFRRYCRRFFAEDSVNAEIFDANISALLFRYRESALFAQLNLLDSHDVSRFFSLCGEDTARMELSIVLQMTFPGMPCVFYGDEKGLAGIQEWEYRQAMAWDKSHPLEDVYRKLIALRKAHPALRYGSFRTELAAGKVYRYSRLWDGRKVTVTMNLGSTPLPVPEKGTLLLKKGEKRAIIQAWEYEVREEEIHGGNDL